MYLSYLELVGVKEKDMHEVQRTEMRRVFFACAGQMLIYIRDVVPEMEEEKAVGHLSDMLEETEAFWKKQ